MAFLTSKILNDLMGNMSEAELAKATHVPKATINRILSGKTPDPRTSTLLPISHYFGISVEQLLGLVALPASMPFKSLSYTGSIATIPLIDFEKIHAWIQKDYLPNYFHEIIIDKQADASNYLYITQSNTWAMLPKFQENTYLIVNRDLATKNNDFVIYHIHNQGTVFRQFFLKDAHTFLRPLHPRADIITLTEQDLYLGRVIESRLFLK